MSRRAPPAGSSLTWLHLSDLHFGPDPEYDRQSVLDAFVQAIEAYRTSRGWKPDIVFVTGDIANRGADEEYKRATEFFNNLLAAVALPKDRLLVVPGNHDIDRTQGWLLERTLKGEDESDRFFAGPSPRAKGAGPTDLHLRKLRAFRAWHDSYFGDVHTADPLSQCAASKVVEVGGARVGILPINSAIFCFDDSDHNKLWVGRSWISRALREIAADDVDLRIALLHHPLDWLADDERSEIKRQLFEKADVILRGHLHETELEATASARGNVLQFAAGAAYQGSRWPQRALFARVELEPGTVRIHPICFQKNSGQWTLDTSAFPEQHGNGFEGSFDLPRPKGSPPRATLLAKRQDAPRSKVRTHERVWTVFPDGIAEVQVTLTDVEMHGGLVLAMPERPYCDVAHDESASAAGKLAVTRDEQGNGPLRFLLQGDGRHDRCEWTYRLSNALALDANEVRWLHREGNGMAGRTHRVRADCEHLRLVYQFESDAGPIVDTAHPVAEAEISAQGIVRWQRDEVETARCRVETSPDGHTVTLTVDAPRYDYRYTLAYVPKPPGRPFPPEAEHRARTLLEECRHSFDGRDGLVGSLTESIDRVLQEQIPQPFSGSASWLGLIWNGPRALLLPAFGHFANEQWSVRFHYGSGVAGHAFRFAKVAMWHREHAPKRSVIFQPKTDAGSGYARTYRWVVCIPILVGLQGPAIGVVSLASDDDEAAADAWLSQLALDAGSGDEATRAAAIALSEKLAEAINTAFWDGLQNAPQTGPRKLQRWAAGVLQALAAT